jgi:GT2 family glycosyltransferase
MSAIPSSDLAISIIIPAFNAERTIGQCLDAITKALPNKKEIIVVDDGSTDRTREIISQFKVKLICQTKNKGAAAAKNVGLGQAAGEIIAFIDSDCIIQESYFTDLIQVLDDTKLSVGGVGGVISPFEGGLISDSFSIRFFGCSPIGETKIREIDSLSGGSSIYPKTVLSKVGGFDECLGGGEDFDLNVRIRKIGYKLLLVPYVEVFHIHPVRLSQLTKKWFNYGKLSFAVSQKNGLKKDVSFSLGWFYSCFALLLTGLITLNSIVWGLLILFFCVPWLINYGKETVKFWVHNPKVKYLAFPFIHQIVIISRTLGVVIAPFSYIHKR